MLKSRRVVRVDILTLFSQKPTKNTQTISRKFLAKPLPRLPRLPDFSAGRVGIILLIIFLKKEICVVLFKQFLAKPLPRLPDFETIQKDTGRVGKGKL